jgi:hypothetical protein
MTNQITLSHGLVVSRPNPLQQFLPAEIARWGKWCVSNTYEGINET